jgi:predicted aspartyl protease
MSVHVHRAGLLLAGLWVLFTAGVASAKEPPGGLVAAAGGQSQPVDPAKADKLALTEDLATRMTVPVMIDGRGPFPFVIDTGADRTVLSTELAAQLGLQPGAPVALHSTAGMREVQTVRVPSLKFGKLTVSALEAPLLSASAIGAAGMLGVDSLGSQHIVLDFAKKQLLTMPSRKVDEEVGAIVVHGRYQFGQLVLVDARIRETFVYVILDTGAQNSVGNPALLKMLMAGRHKDMDPQQVQVVSVTGEETKAEFQVIPAMQIGQATIVNMPLAFAQLHTFDLFGLKDRPALLLGMDILSQFRKVTVDFKRREASFTIN